MFVVRIDQMEALRRAAEDRFVAEMQRHLAAYAPAHCAAIGERQADGVIRHGLAGATRHGFTNRGPVQLYLEFVFMFGSGFDSDPLLPWVAAALRPGGLADDQMARAEILYQGLLDYLAAVDGPGHVFTLAALRRLHEVLARTLPAPPEDPAGLAAQLSGIHPEKCAYVGQMGLRALIEEAAATAVRLGLPGPRGTAAVCRLMFTLGHSCFEDRLYPWVMRTVTDPGLADPLLRLTRLEARERAFLTTVLAEAGPG